MGWCCCSGDMQISTSGFAGRGELTTRYSRLTDLCAQYPFQISVLCGSTTVIKLIPQDNRSLPVEPRLEPHKCERGISHGVKPCRQLKTRLCLVAVLGPGEQALSPGFFPPPFLWQHELLRTESYSKSHKRVRHIATNNVEICVVININGGTNPRPPDSLENSWTAQSRTTTRAHPRFYLG